MNKDWKVGEDEYVHLDGIVLKPSMVSDRRFEKWADGRLVPIPISNRYNGGFTFTDKNGNEQWARGFEVGSPVIPKGYELISIYSGGNLMASPNTVDMLFRKKKLTVTK